MTFAYNPEGEWTNQHLMSVNGKYKDFTLKDFFAVADRFEIGEARFILDEVRDAIKSWETYAEMAKVTPHEIKRVKNLHLLFEE